jgi:photosystem II stability/assembly factor-like uncharacterized protein
MFSETKYIETGKNLYWLFITLFLCSVMYPQDGWFRQSPLPTGNYLNDVHFINENIGYAVGNNGTIIKTIDGGENWCTQQSEITTQLNSIFFIDNSNGWVVGGNKWFQETDSSVILNTTDGGLTWISQSFNTNIPLNDV